MSTSFDFDEFNLDWIKMENKNTPRILVYGPTGSGKTRLVMDILFHNQDVPFVTVISPTERFNHSYTGTIPEMFIHDFSKEIIRRYIQRQEFIQDSFENDPDYANVDTRSILILDDCLHKIKNIKYDEDVDFLFIAGRWVSAAPIIAVQDPIGLSPTQRGQLSYTFIFYEPLETNKKKLYQHYASVFPSFKAFSDALDKVTQNYGCMVIDNCNKRARNLRERVFWYRSQVPKKFRMCDELFWEAPARNEVYDPHSKEKYRRDDGSGGGGGGGSSKRTNVRLWKNDKPDEYNPQFRPP